MRSLIIAALLLGAVGCSAGETQPQPTASSMHIEGQDQVYVRLLRNRYPEFNSVRDDLLTQTGRNICMKLDVGVPVVNIVTQPVDPPLTREMWAYTVGAAVGIYCPKHEEEIRKLQNGG